MFGIECSVLEPRSVDNGWRLVKHVAIGEQSCLHLKRNSRTHQSYVRVCYEWAVRERVKHRVLLLHFF